MIAETQPLWHHIVVVAMFIGGLVGWNLYDDWKKGKSRERWKR